MHAGMSEIDKQLVKKSAEDIALGSGAIIEGAQGVW